MQCACTGNKTKKKEMMAENKMLKEIYKVNKKKILLVIRYFYFDLLKSESILKESKWILEENICRKKSYFINFDV